MVKTHVHSFEDILNKICKSGLDTESRSHYLPQCPVYNAERHTLRSILKNIDDILVDFTEPILIKPYFLIETLLT